MKTSLIIPVYNESQYIQRLLDSIIHSSVQPTEILICDNKSTDDTLKQIEIHKNALPVKILHEEKKGILPTVEKLWRGAKGDLIFKTDADSELPKNWIRNGITHFQKNPKLDACTGPILSSDGELPLKLFVNAGYLAGIPAHMVIRGFLPMFGPNAVFRRRALEKVNGYVTITHDLDDQIISRKFAKDNLTVRWFPDMYNYHSTRRFRIRPKAMLEAVLSLFDTKYYTEK